MQNWTCSRAELCTCMLVFYDALLIVPWFVLFNQRVQMCNSLE